MSIIAPQSVELFEPIDEGGLEGLQPSHYVHSLIGSCPTRDQKVFEAGAYQQNLRAEVRQLNRATENVQSRGNVPDKCG